MSIWNKLIAANKRVEERITTKLDRCERKLEAFERSYPVATESNVTANKIKARLKELGIQ